MEARLSGVNPRVSPQLVAIFVRAGPETSAAHFVDLTRRGGSMANDNRNRRNQPPTGEGKKQNPVRGAARKIGKRSEVVQAQRGHPELNLGTSGDEAARDRGEQRNPHRPKAGR